MGNKDGWGRTSKVFWLREKGQPDMPKGGKGKMRGRFERLRKVFIFLICTGTLWMAGFDSSLPNAFGQSVFQSYNRPQAVPDFSLPDLQGKQVDIRGHRGQVILLNFWATW
jgi:hypothetical protein